jgi:poly(3-hydroxybutyrate) depolymerase/LysM repeat protein
MKKLFSAVLSFVLFITFISVGTITKAATADSTAHVTPLTLGQTKVLVYYPANSLTDASIVKLSTTAPTFVVYGDSSQYTESNAAKYIESLGFDKLAAAAGGVVVVVNGLSAEGWGEKDAASLGTVAGGLNDSSTSPSTYGISKTVNFMTKAEETKIVGNTQNIHVYGVGKGANFVGKYLLTSQATEMKFPDGNVIKFDNTPASVTLVGSTEVPVLNDTIKPRSDKYNTELRVAAVNCDASKLQALTELGSANYTVVNNKDTAVAIAETFNSFNKKFRRQVGILIPVHDYAAEGIVEKIETYIVKTSPDNKTFTTATHPINYVTYYSKELNVTTGKVPLVLAFHGGGNTALYEAQATEWPQIGKENGFITVSVDLHHPNATATEVVELISHLQQEYPAIDSSRIYASGFSMGGVKNWDLFEQFPKVFAGLAPMDASAEVGVDSFNSKVSSINSNVLVPVFYVAGETSPLPEMPFQAQKLIDRVAYTFNINGVTAKYEKPDFTVNKIWGINGDKVYTVADTKHFKDSILTVNLFKSKDGNYYTAMASASNMSHEVYARNSWAAWDFLKQFSRKADGTIQIGSEVAAKPETKPAADTYKVVKGDSLWKIAEKLLGNGRRFNEIKVLNGLKSNVIHVNQILLIPNK